MMNPLFRQIICFILTVTFALTAVPPLRAQELYLPKPGVRVSLSPAFNPPVLKGLKVHPDNPFRFDFILDQGDSLPLVGRAREGDLKEESTKLIKYFLASLTIPEQDLWVNLSPYEKDRIVPTSFGQTEMGRDLLAQDYLLKQITASLIYPEDEFGKKFWNRIYAEAQRKYGTTNIPVNTFNKVWIVPEKAVVYENAQAGTAYVVESRLKVMLEQDYLALEKNVEGGHVGQAAATAADPNVSPSKDVNALGSQIVREIVIPELTKEVNEGKNFAALRQVYNSLILATWYKKKIKDSILSQVYADKNKIQGLSFPKSSIGNPDTIYQQYLTALKKGVYNYIKEEQDPITQQMIPRKYFSGGFGFETIDSAMSVTRDGAMIGDLPDAFSVQANIQPDNAMAAKQAGPDAAMAAKNEVSQGAAVRPLVRMTTGRARLFDGNAAIGTMLEEMFAQRSTPVVYDIGIGWSRTEGPVTVKELAGSLPNTARVIGIDSQIPAYQVIRKQSGSADETILFDDQGRILSWQKYQNVETGDTEINDADKSYLADIFQYIRDKVGPDRRLYQEKGMEVIYDPIQMHRESNLQYVKADLFDLQTASGELSARLADIVRIANVVIPHFGPEAIAPALRQLFSFVNEGGMVLIGWSHPGVNFEGEDYLVYQKKEGTFRLIQYAFTMNMDAFSFGSGMGTIASPAGDLNMRNDLIDMVRDRPGYDEILRFMQAYPKNKLGEREQQAIPYKTEFMKMLAEQFNTRTGVPVFKAMGPMALVDLNALDQTQAPAAVQLDGLIKKSFFDKGVPRQVGEENAMTAAKQAGPDAAMVNIAKVDALDRYLRGTSGNEWQELTSSEDLKHIVLGNLKGVVINDAAEWLRTWQTQDPSRIFEPLSRAIARGLPSDISPTVVDNLKGALSEAIKNAGVHGNKFEDGLPVYVAWEKKDKRFIFYVYDLGLKQGDNKLNEARQLLLFGGGGGTGYYNVLRRQGFTISEVTPVRVDGQEIGQVISIETPDLSDKALLSTPGGIDFKSDKVDSAFAIRNSDGEISAKGGYASGVKFNIDPVLLEQLQNAPGFVPVIINIQPMTDLRLFLGVQETSGNSIGAV